MKVRNILEQFCFIFKLESTPCLKMEEFVPSLIRPDAVTVAVQYSPLLWQSSLKEI